MIKILIVVLSLQIIIGQQNAVANKSMEELSAMMGAKMPTFRDMIKSQVEYSKLDNSLKGYQGDEIPESFDARGVFNECEVPVENQGQCGSCWAFSACSAFRLNLCAASKQQINYGGSQQQILDCVEDPSRPGHIWGCDGGFARDALNFMHDKGITNDRCIPYEEKVQKCRNGCSSSGQLMTNQKCSSVVGHFGWVRSDIVKRAIMQYGGVSTGFTVYWDLVNYKSGVFKHQYPAEVLGTHAVTVIGWGVEDGLEYWLTQNSWGSDWGDHGYWKHAVRQYPGDGGFFGIYGYWYCAQQQTIADL